MEDISKRNYKLNITNKQKYILFFVKILSLEIELNLFNCNL